MNQYLLVYNNIQGFDQSKIHDVITSINTLKDWWHYLPNTYILSIESNSKFVTDTISSNFPGLLFFITKVDLNDHNGVLGKDAWEWIGRKNKALIKIKQVSSLSRPFLGYVSSPRSQSFEDILKQARELASNK